MNQYLLAALVGAMAIFTTLDASAEPRNVKVFGDSLSAYANAWPDHMDTNMRNYAQGGLTLRDFEIPSYVSCSNKHYRDDEVVLWLGTNDATIGWPPTRYSAKLREILTVLRLRGCTVYLALTPEWTEHHLIAPRVAKYRKVQTNLASRFGNVEVFEMPYYTDMLQDMIHPNNALAQLQADFMEQFLGER